MNPKSHTLFHFTKNSDVLKSIIKNGFWPRYCAEDITWLGDDAHKFIAYPMVCFCDIPLSRIDEHISFYGEYGIGLTKEWAERNAATPVHYVSPSSSISQSWELMVNISRRLDDDSISEIHREFRYLLAHTKPTEVFMVVSGQMVKKEFYQESEWRYVPKNDAIADHLMKDQYEQENELQTHNEKAFEHCKLTINPTDIKYIFVRSDADIPNIINFIQQELDHFLASDLKILMSRVISIENIQRDM